MQNVKQLRNFRFVIIDDNSKNGLKTKAVAERFSNLHFLAMADNYDDGLDIVLEYNPDIIFLEIDPQNKNSKLSLAFINDLYRYLDFLPSFFITTTSETYYSQALKYGVFDYFIKPIQIKELRKTLFRLEKELKIHQTEFINSQMGDMVTPIVTQLKSEGHTEIIKPVAIDDPKIEPNLDVLEKELEEVVKKENTDEILTTNPIEELSSVEESENYDENPETISIKSYEDFRTIETADICYLMAENTSTDIHLCTGEIFTAFDPLNHFEEVLMFPFVRIHGSYMVNVDYVSRIYPGNAFCHIKNTTTKLPFSTFFKEKMDAIMNSSKEEVNLEDGSTRTVLRLPPVLAPTKVAVFPLLKKNELQEEAHKIVEALKWDFSVVYDEQDSMEKRCKRQDELGTPFGLIVDYQTLEGQTVMVRHRDSSNLERIKIVDLRRIISEEISMRNWLI